MTKGTGKQIKIGPKEAETMKQNVGAQMKQNPTAIQSDLETEWVINKKESIDRSRLVTVQFNDRKILYDGHSYTFNNSYGYFTQYTCKVSSNCQAGLNLINSAKPGVVLAIVMNQTHTGHKIRNRADYNSETGRSIALEELISACKILKANNFDLDEVFSGGANLDDLDNKNDELIRAANLISYSLLLWREFREKFDGKLDGASRVYGHLHVSATGDTDRLEFVNLLRYLGQSKLSVKERSAGDSNLFFQVIKRRNACDSYQFKSVQVESGVSETYAKSAEALCLNLFIKDSNGKKQIVNDRYETLKIELDNDLKNLQLGAFLLIRGCIFGKLEEIDLRPKLQTNQTRIDEDKFKMIEDVRLAPEKAKELEQAKQKLEQSQSLVDQLKDLLRQNGVQFEHLLQDNQDSRGIEPSSPKRPKLDFDIQ